MACTKKKQIVNRNNDGVNEQGSSAILLSDNINEYVRSLSHVVDFVHVVDNARRVQVMQAANVIPIKLPATNISEFWTTYILKNKITTIYAQGRKSLWMFARIMKKIKIPPRIIVTCHNSSVLENTFKTFVFLLSARFFSHGVVFLSKRSFRKWHFFCQCIGLPSWNLPNPVELERFPIIERTNASTEIVIGSIGAMLRDKGQHIILNALSILISKGYNIKVKLAGGDGDINFKNDLIKFTQMSQLTERVEWMGEIKYDKIPCFLKMIDLYVCSSYREVMPFSILEAMASGLPIVASDIAGIPDLVCDDENGYVVQVGRADLLAEAIEKIIIGKMFTQFGKNSRHLAEKRFSCETIAPFMKQILLGSPMSQVVN